MTSSVGISWFTKLELANDICAFFFLGDTSFIVDSGGAACIAANFYRNGGLNDGLGTYISTEPNLHPTISMNLLGFIVFIVGFVYCSGSSLKPDEVDDWNHRLKDSRFHLCLDNYEAYSSSIIFTKEHLINQNILKYNLSEAYCEMASFIMMRNHANMQTLDVLDLSIVNLSSYERYIKKKLDPKKNPGSAEASAKYMEPVTQMATLVKRNTQAIYDGTTRRLESHKLFHRTLVLMPFVGFTRGTGHSKAENRFHYLQACFWSFYEHFPNIIVTVLSRMDYDYLT